MRKDVEFLKQNGLMDYSMLLAVEIDPDYEEAEKSPSSLDSKMSLNSDSSRPSNPRFSANIERNSDIKKKSASKHVF